MLTKVGQKGQEPDEEFDGPMKKRGCTDIICLLIFISFIGGMVAVCVMALQQHGDPYRLLFGYDIKGDTCGTTNSQLNIYNKSGEDLSNKPYLYIDISKSALAKFTTTEGLTSKFSTEHNVDLDVSNLGTDPIHYCLTGNVSYSKSSEINPNATSSPDASIEDKILQFDAVDSVLTGGDSCRYCVDQCPENHTTIFWRCVPDAVPGVAGDTAKTFFESSGAKSFIEEIISDISSSWLEIIYMCAVALGLSIIMIILFRFLAGFIVWIIIWIIALACLAGPLVCWYVWYTKKQDFSAKNNNGTLVPLTNNSDVIMIENKIDNEAKKLLSDDLTSADSEKEVKNWFIISIVVSVVAVIILLILLVLRKRIKLVVQLFKEAGKAVHSMPLILLQPFWTLISLIALAGLWTIALAFIETAGEPTFSDNQYVTYKKGDFWTWIRLYHLFGLLWLANFIIACQHVVIAGAVAGWYFVRDKSDLKLPVATSFWRLVRYHLGSVAFGSFIIALVQLIRIIMQYIERKLAKKGGPCGKALGPIIKCCQCCLWCFEKCLKFLNKNAYIEVAIYGYNFCKAAQKAFALLTSNILRVAAINSVGTFVLFLGKVAVVVSTVFIGVEIMQLQTDSGKLVVKNQWPAIFLAAVFAYMIIDCFIGVYGMAIDTIFLCFCEDSERNDGITKPYFMSKGLMEFVENSSKALEALEKRQEAENAPKIKQNQVQPQENTGMPQVA